MRKRENNRGFTLVELIIAVAILAIAIAPLMANFIQSSKMNLKGRKNLNATNLAQSVMEGMSAYSADELDEIMVSANTINLGQYILPPGTDYDSAEKDLTNSDENKYCYTIKNVKTTDGNYNAYDLEITVDGTVDPTTNRNGYNQNETASITEVDQYYDAIYSITQKEVSDAISELLADSSNHMNTAENYYGNLVREMNIIIANEGTEDVPVYTVKVNNTYSVRESALAALGLTSDDKSTQTSGNISNTKEDRLPRSVYVYFEGMENATKTEELENIKITNTTGQDVDVYLIRTQNKNAVDTGYNGSFGCKVEVVSQNPDGSDSENVNVISNLRFHLSYPLENNYRSHDESGVEIAGIDRSQQTFYSNDRAEYIYNGAIVSEAVYQKHIYDGYKIEKKNVLYDVTIDIYEVGDPDKKVATYTGGLSN